MQVYGYEATNAIAGPSKPPWPSVSHVSDTRLRRPRRRRSPRIACTCLALLAATIPTTSAATNRGDRAPMVKRGLADYYEKSIDGRWVPNANWSLNGRNGDPPADKEVGSSIALAADDKAAAPSASTSSTPVASSTPTALSQQAVGAPSAWTDGRERTPYYAIPLIVCLSIFLAVGICILIFVVVYIKQKRRRRKEALERADTESIAADAEKANEKPTTKRARLATAVRKRTGGLRRRRKTRMVPVVVEASPRDDASSTDEGDQPESTSPSPSPPPLQRSASQLTAVSVASTRQDSDADSVTALTSNSDAPRRRFGRSRAPAPTVSFARARQASVVSVESTSRLPPAPPAYGTQPSTSRRDEKRRAVETEEEEEGPPSIEAEEEAPTVDRGEVSGHVATDEKEALRRLTTMASAPEASGSVPIGTAPDEDEVDEIGSILATDPSAPSAPSLSDASVLPAPPSAVEQSYTGLARPIPSAPSAPSAPWLPQYEPSAPAYEPSEASDDDVRSIGSGDEASTSSGGRQEHAVI